MRWGAGLRKRTLIPLAVGVLTFAAFLGSYLAERTLQRERLAAELALLGSNFAARLETHLAARLNAGQVLVRDMTDFDDAGVERFRAEAALLHDLFGDFQALNWVDAAGVIRVVTPEQGNAAALGLDLRTLPLPAAALAAAETTQRPQVTPPLELAQGGTGFVAYLPIVADNEITGFLNMVFRAGPLMASALGGDSARDYSYRVLDGEAPLYASGEAGTGPGNHAETRMQAGNRTWRLHVAATQTRLQAAASRVDEALLFLGVISAGLTSALARLLIIRQNALRDSRARLHDFATSTSDWFWEMDEDRRLTWCTESIEAIFGHPREHLIGRRRDEFRVSANDDDAWAAHLEDLAARRPFRDFQYATEVGGTLKWLRISGLPRFDEYGQFTGYRGSATDVTDLLRSRTEVEQANARLAAAVENLDEMFSLWDSEDRLVFGNRVFRRLNANVPEVLTPGTRFEDYLRAGIEAGHMYAFDGSAEEFLAQSIARRHAPDSEPFEIMRSDGITLLLHEQGLEDGGNVTIGLDVTRQRESDAALRASEERLALAVSQLSIWDWDLGTGKLYLSPGFHEALGYDADEFEAIKAGSVADIMHPEDVEAYRAKLEAHLENPAEGFRSQHRFRTKSGDYRWFLAIGQASRDASGRTGRSTGVLTDVTERVELEERLQQAHKMEAIGNLTGGVAHDFNNLLAVILGNLELIRETDNPEDIARYSAAAITATRRGADLVRNMLSFARKARLEPRPLDLNQVVTDTKAWCDRVLSKSISLEVPPSGDLWTVEADPNLVQNALLNLVVNARDAMPEGGRLTIETRNVLIGDAHIDAEGAVPASGRYVMLAVRDTGCGIPKAHLETIFEPFFTTKPPGSGSGLGLSMVHGFLKQSGGLVRVDSEPGTGTTFKLYFPARQADAPDTKETPGVRMSPPNIPARILVVEDDPTVLDVITETLAKAGYRTTSALSGDAALKLWQDTSDYDLLITDIVMPGELQGTHLAKAVRALIPELPVIFMSGYAKEAKINGNGLKPEDIRLMKPVGKSDLLTAVATALTRKA